MCIHTLVHPICRTCRRPITPPTPGTVVRIAYCPQAWDRLSASRRPWFSMSSPPPGSAFLSAPRLPSCHRCSPQSQPQSESRNYTWDSRDLCLEADEWMVYSQAQPERYARMCAWVYPPSSPHPSGGAPSIPSPEGRQSGDGDEDGNNRSGGDILRGYDWAIHGVPVPGSPWRAVPEFWRMKKPSFEKEKK
ncbi:hypothetical protein F5X96DRAFT_684530 [Biscogniauxia mediterranea]|nr:hypothetical protein F5X96DRAFT_684530 [Biscogniauxia mediterranea]